MKLYAKWAAEGAEEEKAFPSVHITTADGNGNALHKTTGYVPAVIRINSDINGEGQVKVRGNSTAYAEKKPYTIKFTNKQNVFGMGAAKKWVLLANCFDPTLLRNYLALSMARELRLDYTPEVRYVDLYLDGVYKGNYLLTEAVERGVDRVDINIDAGDFLLEAEAERYEADVTYLISPIYHYRLAMSEPEAPVDGEKEKIQKILFELENAMASGDFAQAAQRVDINSFVDYYILNELLKDIDVGYSSTYFYYKQGKLYAGPVWDYDITTGNINPDVCGDYYPAGDSCTGIWAQVHWMGEMTKHAEFMQMVRYRYRSLQPYIRGLYAENGFLDASYDIYKGAFERNFSEAGWDVSKAYWNYSRQPDSTYEQNYEYLRNWLKNRNEWLCTYWNVGAEVLDYAGYWEAVGETAGYSPLCYENYDALEAALSVDVYREGITQDEINAAAQGILSAIDNLRAMISYITVSYESNGGSAVEAAIYVLGTAIEEPEQPVWAEHRFEGWYLDEELTIPYDFAQIPTGDLVLYAKWSQTGKKIVSISGITLKSRVYTGEAVAYSGTPVVTLAQDTLAPVPEVLLVYSYSGTRADGSDYFSDSAPVDAGEYILTVAVSQEDENYTGSAQYAFQITPAPVWIAAQDVTLTVGEPLPETYVYETVGLLNGDVLMQEPAFCCDAKDTQKAGAYEIIPYGAYAGINYDISYQKGTLKLVEKLPGSDWPEDLPTVQKLPGQTYTGSALKPSVYVCAGDGTFLKAGRDYTVQYFNNINADTEEESLGGGTNFTGEEGIGGYTKALAYVVVTGKGNYKGTIYQNFHIERAAIADADKTPAAGFAMKYTEQIARNDKKTQKPFTSLKYKKSMRAGRDYTVQITALSAYHGNSALASGSVVSQSSGQTLPGIPGGYHGTFLLEVEGIGNYTGRIEQVIYVTDKSHMLKNAIITLGKNQKTVSYIKGEAVTLTPGYYNPQTKKYYAVDKEGVVSAKAERDGSDVFTVKLGKEYLRYGEHYTVAYTGNQAVGNAKMTITGIGEKGYLGSRSIVFRIAGTAFTAKNISVDGDTFRPVLYYTGTELTQDDVILKDITAAGRQLVCGTDYTVSYRNNREKGTATMIFKAKPTSGYSGSFQKKFRIAAAVLDAEMLVVADEYNDSLVSEGESIRLTGKVPYEKGGARPAGRIQIVSPEGTLLQEGADYTVIYADNKKVTTADTSKLPSMIIRGRGNYTGTLRVCYEISASALEQNENLRITTESAAFRTDKGGHPEYQYRPRVKLTDGGKALSAAKDYRIVYENCGQSKVKAYLDALRNGNVTREELDGMRPYAVITAKEGSGYTSREGIRVPLTIYEKKLTRSRLYIVLEEKTAQTLFSGRQLKPKVTVYYGAAGSVAAAAKAKETDEAVLTDQAGKYGLTLLVPEEGGGSDYTLAYGANVTAGKNKGHVTVTGVGMYGGSVTIPFTIQKMNLGKSD